MKPEKALFVDSLDSLLKAGLSGYNRIYFGSETCDRRIASLQEMQAAKELCRKAGLGFSLVTPFASNTGLKALLPLLKALSGEDELVANDFGVAGCASRKSKAVLVAGRLLNRQYRDPRIAFFGKAPPELKHHLSLSHAESRLFRQLLTRFKIKRVELDNLLQGIGTDLGKTGLRASLYIPFVFVSATRFCLMANSEKLSNAKKIGIFPCNSECRQYSLMLEGKGFNKPLYVFGNAVYFENGKIPKNLEKIGVDRLVINNGLRPE